MTQGSDPRPYYPPTQSEAPVGAFPPPPPGYVAYAPARPRQLGIAAGCTIAVGAIALFVGAIMMLGVLVAQYWINWARFFGPVPPTDWIVGAVFVVAFFPVVYGAITVAAGVGLNQRRPSAWTTAVAVNILSLVFALLSTMAAGLGLVHAVLSGIALWALFQTEVKAYFGH